MLSIFSIHSHANRFVQVLFHVWFAICHSSVWTTLNSTTPAGSDGWSKVFESVSHRGLERARRGHCHLRGMLPRLLSCLLLVIGELVPSCRRESSADYWWFLFFFWISILLSSFLLFFWQSLLSLFCPAGFLLCCRRRWLPHWNHDIWRKFVLGADECFQGTDYGDAVWGGLVTLKRRLMCCRRNIANQDRDPPTQAEIQDRVQAACGLLFPQYQSHILRNIGMPAKVQIRIGLKTRNLFKNPATQKRIHHFHYCISRYRAD